MEKMDLHSPNMVNQNIESIAKLFPNCVTETTDGIKIDFEQLKQELSEDVVDGAKERYRLDWPGKREAIVTSNLPTTATLRPAKNESTDFDNTENIYIEGDNLEVLKILQESYLNKIKMIYIDPPYNTGKDFVYRDNFSTDVEEWKNSEERNEEGDRLVVNPETAGRYHSDWLSMMYPRLKLARNLLTDDGVIFISIDDNEVHNLRKMCDDVFGESNFRNQIVIRRGAKSVQAQFDTWDKLGQDIEYILFYTKNNDYRFPKQTKKLKEVRSGAWNNHWRGTDRPTMRYELFGITPETGQWRWSKDRSLKATKNYDKLLSDLNKSSQVINQEDIDKYYLQKNDNTLDFLRLSVNGKPEHYIPPTDSTLLNTSWHDLLIGSTAEIRKLFNDKVFDTPKLIEVIIRMLRFIDKDSLILDFFSGSSTTAHAVMQLNAEDGGNRKYIMVQLPEETDEKSEAYKAGYKTIAEIGKERIRRAAQKIKEETNADIDYGFRVYKLDSSNMKDVYYNPASYTQQDLGVFIDNIKEDRTEEDLVTQVMLDWGLPLSLNIEQKEISGKKVYTVADSYLYCCFDKGLDETFAKEVAKHTPERIVFRDTGFANDTAKENVKQLLKQLSPDTEMRVV